MGLPKVPPSEELGPPVNPSRLKLLHFQQRIAFFPPNARILTLFAAPDAAIAALFQVAQVLLNLSSAAHNRDSLMTRSASNSVKTTQLENIWFTRCPVPTASGLSFSLGWLSEAFAEDKLPVNDLRDAPASLHIAHIDHDLPGLFREGGSIPALAARGSGAPSRVIGLTWIDEWQVILVRKETGPITPAELKGLRIALPAYNETRATSITRGMSLRGISGALTSAGLTFDDVTFVETPLDNYRDRTRPESLQRLWSSIDELVNGTVDAVYVKGAAAVDAARKAGVIVGIDLDALPDPRFRINNGTPRPITVHQDMLDQHFDLVVKFLEQSLRAADWASQNLDNLRAILEVETRAGGDAVSTAYRNDFHLSLHPDLSEYRVAQLKQQADFLWLHGFLEHAVDVDTWIDRGPLTEAYRRFAQGGSTGGLANPPRPLTSHGNG